MERNKYLDYYKNGTSGDREEHYLYFGIRSNQINPDYPSQKADETEQTLKEFIERDYPGVSYKRTGLIFAINVVAYSDRSGHVDYMRRLLDYFIDPDVFEKLNPTDKRLS